MFARQIVDHENRPEMSPSSVASPHLGKLKARPGIMVLNTEETDGRSTENFSESTNWLAFSCTKVRDTKPLITKENIGNHCKGDKPSSDNYTMAHMVCLSTCTNLQGPKINKMVIRILPITDCEYEMNERWTEDGDISIIPAYLQI